MAVVCPTITAYDYNDFTAQLEKLKSFATRLHIDIMDGQFTERASVSLDEISWPSWITVDIHLMCAKPMEYLAELIRLKPNMVIIHNEVEVHHMVMAAELHKANIQAGLALLQTTPVDWADQIMHSFDQVLIFSGHLGSQGGNADLNMLNKVRQIKLDHPTAEIAWDGGINDTNVAKLVSAGVNVLNVGSFIAQSPEPDKAYAKLMQQISDING